MTNILYISWFCAAFEPFKFNFIFGRKYSNISSYTAIYSNIVCDNIIFRNIQGFIEKVHKRVEILPIEEISAMVQNFYQALAKRLETHENFAGLQEDERTTICDLTER